MNARVYAVKANYNRLLDVARETYKENIGDIYQLNRSLSEEHNLPLTLVYQETGFVFALKKNDIEGELPKGFINVSLRKGRWIFSNLELVCLFALKFVLVSDFHSEKDELKNEGRTRRNSPIERQV